MGRAFIKIILIFFFILHFNTLLAEDACHVIFKPDTLSVLLSEQQSVKNCYEIANDKNKFGSTFIPSEATSYCTCMSDNKLKMTRTAEKEILSNQKLKNTYDATTDYFQQKSGEVLRNEIFNTLSRMNKFDNYLKKGIIEEADLKIISQCSLDNILSGLGDFKNDSRCQNSQDNDGKKFDERMKNIFPEGVEKFKKNISDMGNTLAKNVRSKDSCLTYQNYLSISAPTEANGGYSDFKGNSWREFKSKIDEDVSLYKKSLKTELNSDEVFAADNGKQELGFIKADPIFDMAMQDESFYNQVKKYLDGSTKIDGIVNQDILNKLSNDPTIIKALLLSQANKCENKIGSKSKEASGLKNNLYTYLCSPKLPPPSQFAIENLISTSDLNSIKNKEEQEIFSNLIKKKAICESDFKTRKENDPYYSSVDEFISPTSDLDIQKPNQFLAEYKNFSKDYCKYLPPECSNQEKSKKVEVCSNIPNMNNQVILNLAETCFKIYKDSKTDYKDFVNKLLDPKTVIEDDNDMFKIAGMKFNIADKKFKNTECENFFDRFFLLKENTSAIIFDRNIRLLTYPVPDGLKVNPIQYFASAEGKLYYDRIKDTHDGMIIRSMIPIDTTNGKGKTEGSPLFSDYFVNANSADTAKLTSFISRPSNSSNSSIDPISSSTGSSNESGYTRKYETAGPPVANSANSPVGTPNATSEPVIRSLEDLAGISSPKAQLVAEVPKSTFAPETKIIKKVEPVVTAKEAKPKDSVEAPVTKAPSQPVSNAGTSLTLSRTYSSDSSSSQSESSKKVKPATSEDEEVSRLEKTKSELEEKLAKKKQEYEEMKNGGSAAGSDNSEYEKEKKRLTDEMNKYISGSNNSSSSSSRNSYSNNDSNFSNNTGNSNSVANDSSNTFNNGYGRGEEFDKEKAKNKIDDGSAAFDPESKAKDASKSVASSDGGQSSGSSKAKGGSGPKLSQSGSDGEGISGTDSGLNRKNRRRGPAGLDSEVEAKCGTGSVLKCIFPNSYFVDSEIKNRLYAVIANLKLEGRKFQTLEKIRKSKKDLKMGESNKPKYYLYTYDLILKDKNREVTNEERDVIYQEIKVNRQNVGFKKKLVQYRLSTKVVPPKLLLNDQEALDAVKRSITKEDYEALQD